MEGSSHQAFEMFITNYHQLFCVSDYCTDNWCYFKQLTAILGSYHLTFQDCGSHDNMWKQLNQRWLRLVGSLGPAATDFTTEAAAGVQLREERVSCRPQEGEAQPHQPDQPDQPHHPTTRSTWPTRSTRSTGFLALGAAKTYKTWRLPTPTCKVLRSIEDFNFKQIVLTWLSSGK